MKKTDRVVLALVSWLVVLPAWSADLWLHCGRLLDVDKGRLLEDRYVEVSQGRIASVSDQPPESAPAVLDLTDQTCLPGLMDMHTHLAFEFGPRAYLERFQFNAADYAIRASRNAEKTLMAGFTTVRDLGDVFNVTVALRKAVDAGIVSGPRIFTAGKSLASTGGHADPTNGVRADWMGNPGPELGVVNGVDDARKAVRQRYKDGVDVIKLTATGGVLSLARSGDNPQFTVEEIAAIVDTAHDYGFVVAAHAHGAEGMRRAVLGGVDSIEHGTYMDRNIAALMKKHGTWYVPTLLAGQWVAEKAAIDGFFPPVVRDKAARIGPQLRATFAMAHKAGVPIAFGTDSGVSAHGGNAREFALMVQAGMSPLDAIRSATVHAARLLNMEDELGRISPGLRADLVAVAGNPLEDIRLLEDVRWVIKDGVVYKRP